MSVIMTGNFPRDLLPGVKKHFGNSYNMYSSLWNQMFQEEMSDQSFELAVGVNELGLAPVKAQGASIQFDSAQQTYVSTFTNITYGLGFIVTREEIEDNKYNTIIKLRAGALGRSMSRTREVTSANVFNRGFSGSYVYGDGQPAFSASHPTTAGLQSNLIAVAADLSEAALEQIAIDISNALDDKGNVIRLYPRQLWIPTALQFEAKRILGDPDRPATADRDINAMYALGTFAQGYMFNPYLSDSDAWFVKTDCPDSFISWTRRKVGIENDNEFTTENLQYKATMRHTQGVADWRGYYASPGA